MKVAQMTIDQWMDRIPLAPAHTRREPGQSTAHRSFRMNERSQCTESMIHVFERCLSRVRSAMLRRILRQQVDHSPPIGAGPGPELPRFRMSRLGRMAKVPGHRRPFHTTAQREPLIESICWRNPVSDGLCVGEQKVAMHLVNHASLNLHLP